MREQVDAPHQKSEGSIAPTAWRIYSLTAVAAPGTSSSVDIEFDYGFPSGHAMASRGILVVNLK
ncbi:MAG: hypothetical protein V7K97_18700 [Nostoc sp.]|uniref:hypothetical protein n=1 Tax=Nostoc sp. TaxID=1180 RepID=UPI002FF7CC41